MGLFLSGDTPPGADCGCCCHCERRVSGNEYPSTYTDATKPSYTKQYGKVVHDCNGLIKGYFWKDSFDGSYNYQSNGLSDINEAEMYSLCREKGSIGSMPEVKGLLVFLLNGSTAYHVGIYIGNGEVIEARGHDYGVIKSQISAWQAWGKFPLLEYVNEKDSTLISAFIASALADEVKFSWNEDIATAAKNCLVQQWPDGKYRNTHLTLLAQNLLKMPKEERDGYCGPVTTAAIKKYQAGAGLVADGGIGAKTWEKLLGV